MEEEHPDFPASDFYLKHLANDEKTLYRQIVHDLGFHKSASILPGNVDLKRLLTIARYVTLDFPEFYWSKGDFTATRRDGLFIVQWDDLCPACWTKRIDAEIFHTLEMLNLNRFSLVRDKVAVLQEWFCSNVIYDLGADQYQQRIVQTLFPVYLEGKGVCLGISKAAKMMLDLSGEHSIIILGKLFHDETHEHAWNLVREGDHYLHTDFTVTYPVFEPLWHSYYPGRKQSCLLVPSSEIALSHSILPGLTYPI